MPDKPPYGWMQVFNHFKETYTPCPELQKEEDLLFLELDFWFDECISINTSLKKALEENNLENIQKYSDQYRIARHRLTTL